MRRALRLEDRGSSTPTSRQELLTSKKPISPLRQRVLEDMSVRRVRPARKLGLHEIQWQEIVEHGLVVAGDVDVGEFTRRFLIHVLPRGFHRICHLACSPAAIAPQRLTLCVSS